MPYLGRSHHPTRTELFKRLGFSATGYTGYGLDKNSWVFILSYSHLLERSWVTHPFRCERTNTPVGKTKHGMLKISWDHPKLRVENFTRDFEHLWAILQDPKKHRFHIPFTRLPRTRQIPSPGFLPWFIAWGNRFLLESFPLCPMFMHFPGEMSLGQKTGWVRTCTPIYGIETND